MLRPEYLRCGQIKLHEPTVVRRLLEGLAEEARYGQWYSLGIDDGHSVRIVGSDVPTVAGWYIICDAERRPLYVGQAQNLGRRLVSRGGGRNHGSERSFIAAFLLSGVLSGAQVMTIREDSLARRLGYLGNAECP